MSVRATTRLRPTLKKWYYSYWPGQAGSFPYFGTRVHFPRSSHLFLRVCEEEIFESELLRFIRQFLRNETAYFDVGANIGLTSAPFLRDIPTCSVVSFEPSPHALPYLLKTQAGSPFGSRWKVIGKALGNQIGQAEFYTTGLEKSAFDGFRDTRRGGKKEIVQVPVTTLDSEWEGLGRPAVSVVKIDVEGTELGVLQGGVCCVRAEQPAIFLEWKGVNLKAAECPPAALLDWAANERYQIYSLPLAIPVTDWPLLKLQMTCTGQFVLLPKGKAL